MDFEYHRRRAVSISKKIASRNFLRSVLRSAKILMQNSATLRNALRKLNYESPSISNAMQSSETLRNSLGLNYESPALTAELQAQFHR
jgi:hypothetical protein